MNKLEVGMYVRFNWKKQQIPILIGKITEVHYDEDEKYYFYLTDNGLVIGEDNFVKEPSHNIIDLIEVGDVITTNNLCGQVTYIEGDKIYTTCYDGECCYDYQIQSIVTKEQFKSMEYKVEGQE